MLPPTITKSRKRWRDGRVIVEQFEQEMEPCPFCGCWRDRAERCCDDCAILTANINAHRTHLDLVVRLLRRQAEGMMSDDDVADACAYIYHMLMGDADEHVTHAHGADSERALGLTIFERHFLAHTVPPPAPDKAEGP